MDLPDHFVAAALHAADLAAAAVRPFFRRPLVTDRKDDESPVTIADRTAEAAVRALLRELLPDHGIIGEEGGEEAGTGRGEARFRWVLDPIDGTRAFITGRPLFGTLIALLDGDRPVLGVLDQPITRERWVGLRGRDTVFTGAPGRVGGRACPALAEAELSCTSPEIFGPAEWTRFRALQAACRRTTWGGDCYGYGLVALGGVDVIAEAGLKLWDWAALLPIIEGAGGSLTRWDGSPLRAGPGSFDVLALGNRALLPAATQLLSA